MRIGIDVRCLSEGKRTGVEEYTVQLLKHLFELDKENRYVLFINSWHEPRAGFGWIEVYPNVELKRFHWPNKLLNLCLWYFRWPRIDLWLGGTDIFFMPNLNFVAVSRETRLVVTAHDVSFDLHPETFSIRRRIWHGLVHFRGLIRRAHRVIAVSASTRADIMALYAPAAKKIRVIHNGISERFHPIDRNDPELLRVKGKYRLPYKFILFFGTIEPRKNLVALIRAFVALARSGDPELEKYSLVIAGARGWRDGGVFDEAERSGVSDRIIFTGFVEENDQAALYNLASLFVYPSVYEGFGFPPLEAAACGTPVVTSNVSVFPETIGGAGILVDPWNPEELFLAMKEILLDRDLRSRLREAGFRRAGEFDWRTAARRTHKLFEKIGRQRGS